MNWYLRYLTSNDPKKTVTKTGLYFRKVIYPLVRRLSGPLTDVRGIMVKVGALHEAPGGIEKTIMQIVGEFV